MSYSKWLFHMLALFFLFSCKNSAQEETDKTQIQILPLQRQLSPVEISAQNAIIEIEKSEIASGGDAAIKIDIEGMEMIRCSQKKYLEDELQSQQENFKQYLDYLDRMKNNPVINDPKKRIVSVEKHNAVIAYLQKEIGKASANPELYKIAYYMRAVTKKRTYTQTRTAYLDSSMKQIKADYGFLQR